MKRIFIILCLITICNISYADIASTGYVDSVVATKQDSITDIETIRSGAGLGATAVQPSSLSTVATSGSYNDLTNKPTIPTVPTTISSFTNDSGYITTSYHDSTKQDKLPNVPGNNGKYKLVWNNNTGQLGWEFEQFSLTCSSGTYDIGFSQCIDPATNGTGYGYINDGVHSWLGPDHSNESVYDLTQDNTWGVTLYTGDKIKGEALCSSTNGTYAKPGDPDEAFDENTSQYCWCRMTSPAASRWVFKFDYGDASNCALGCAYDCASNVQRDSGFRPGVFAAVGQ